MRDLTTVSRQSRRTVLVLGATGLLGQAIVAEALNRGFVALGAARSNAQITLNIADESSLRSSIVASNPFLVVNAAALTILEACEKDPGLSYLLNARPTSIIREACREMGAKLVHISTDHFFTGDGNRLHDEAAPVRLLNEYARTKYAGETFALTDPTALVIRTNITGWRGWADRPTFFEWLVSSIEDQKPLPLFDDYYTSTIDAPTCASCLFDLVDRGCTGLVNVASTDTLSKKAFAVMTGEALGIPLTIKGISVRSLGTVRAESLGLDVTRAQDLLGYSLPNARCVIDKLLRRRP